METMLNMNSLYQTEDLKHGRRPFRYEKKYGNGNGNDYELVFDLVQARFDKDPDMCTTEQTNCSTYNKVWY